MKCPQRSPYPERTRGYRSPIGLCGLLLFVSVHAASAKITGTDPITHILVQVTLAKIAVECPDVAPFIKAVQESPRITTVRLCSDPLCLSATDSDDASAAVNGT